MRLEAAIVGDLRQFMASERLLAEHAVTAAIRIATDGLKLELRKQVTSAGLGQRLANTWRGKVYPESGQSIAAAGFVWSKAPSIISAFAFGATIRSRNGWFLAIPTKEAGVGARGKRLTPGLWERMHGLRLRFVYRPGRNSLLVADNVRVNSRGLAARNVGSSKGRSFTRLAGRTTIPIFTLVPQVKIRRRLDLDAAAERWQRALPTLIERNWGPDVHA